MAYDNTNRWTLNKNDRKEQDNHPDYKGKINVDGVDYWLDGWIKDSANGKFISGSIKRKDQPSNGYTGSYHGDPASNRSGGVSSADLDDGIPF